MNSEDQLVLLSDIAALKDRMETATADRLKMLILGMACVLFDVKDIFSPWLWSILVDEYHNMKF